MNWGKGARQGQDREETGHLVDLGSRGGRALEGRRGRWAELGACAPPLPLARCLPQDNFGLELAAVEAAVRKHEAIETDIVAYSGRVQAVDAVAAELAAERYHDIRRIAARQHNVARLWDFLRQMVAARRERLLLTLELQKVFQDLLYLMDWMEEMKVTDGPGGAGEHLGGVGPHARPCTQSKWALPLWGSPSSGRRLPRETLGLS